MPYIGRGPSKSGAFRILDDISLDSHTSGGFNGSRTTFALTVGTVALTVGLPETLMIAVDGVIQEPGTAYTISGSNIVFASPPQDSATFWGVELGDVGGLAERATTQAGTDDSTRIATTAHVKDVKIDALTAGDDNTNLDSSTGRHGLLRKLDGTATNFLNGAGNWAAPSGGASLATSTGNQIVTVTGTNAITGEAGLTFDASAPTLKIRGESGAPATSSTTELAVLRLNPTGVTGTLDMGFHADSTGRAWIQATDTGNLATNYNLHLNPNGGNVGIGMGTNAAAKLLHLYQGAHTSGTRRVRASAMLVLEDDTTDEIALQFLMPGTSGTPQQSIFFGDAADGTMGGLIYDHIDNQMRFRANGGDKMYLNNTGLGIGTNSPSKKLHIVGDGFQFENTAGAANETTASFLVATDGYSDEFGSIRFEDNRGTQAQPSFIFAAADGSGGTACFLIKTGTTSTRFQLNQNGDITGTHGNYHTSSDLRAKENIVNSTVGLDAVMQMRPVKFNFIADRGVGTNTRVGFIAQEVEALIPEAVFTADTPNDPIPNIKSIEDPQLIPVLVKAIQELKAEIDALKA